MRRYIELKQSTASARNAPRRAESARLAAFQRLGAKQVDWGQWTLPVDSIIDALADAVDAAREAVADDARWLNAVEAGYDWLLRQDELTVLNPQDAKHMALRYPSESGEAVYEANGACQCAAFARHQACRHRAAARLVRNAVHAMLSRERQDHETGLYFYQ